jgi:hypothetical protein
MSRSVAIALTEKILLIYLSFPRHQPIENPAVRCRCCDPNEPRGITTNDAGYLQRSHSSPSKACQRRAAPPRPKKCRP